MNTRRIIVATIFATFGLLLMSCDEEEVTPTIENSIIVATEGNNGGHDEPPVDNTN